MSTRSPATPPSPDGDSEDRDYTIPPQPPANRARPFIAILVVVIIVLAGVSVAYATGVFKSTGTPNPGGPCVNCSAAWLPECGGSLLAGGSTFVYPLMAVWTNAYSLVKCNSTGAAGATSTQIDYQPVGSGTGITNLAAGLYIFGASDAPLTPTQTRALSVPTVTMPDSAGAVTIIYNLKVTNSAGATVPLNLTGPVLAAIYLGTVTNWDSAPITSLNPGLTIPNEAITVEHRSDGSGTSFAFTTFLCDSNATWNAFVGASTSPSWPTGLGQKGSEGVAGAVAGTTGAIGYDELNYASEEGSNIQIAKVQNPAGNFIFPTVTDTNYAVENASNLPAPTGNWSGYSIINGKGAGTYPISTLTYLMLYEDIGKAPAYGGSITLANAQSLVSFLWWIVHTGQNNSAGLFYVPLPPVLLSLDVTAIGEITYDGQTLQSHAS
jgi:phosphate ABC transporter phosphate-binding protein